MLPVLFSYLSAKPKDAHALPFYLYCFSRLILTIICLTWPRTHEAPIFSYSGLLLEIWGCFSIFCLIIYVQEA